MTPRAVLAAAVLAALAVVAVVATLVLLQPTGDGARSDAVASSSATRSPSAGPTPTVTATPTPTAEPPVVAAPAPPPPPACVDDVLVCVNLARVANGLGELAASGALNGAAQACADRIASSGQLTHSAGGPGGHSAWGENIASGYPSAAAVFDGWMNSAGHRANILNPAYTEMGIGYASGNWWCQQFGG